MTTAVAPSGPELELAPAEADAPPALRAVHTPGFPDLLRRIGSSLLVTTYQAGKLVMVRGEGDRLNTHFRTFPAPMGMALDGDRLAVGTSMQVWEFVNVPAVAAKLDQPGRHDACYLPRSCHVTGNIQVHEMAWGAGRELWVVNTRFSCLCTIDPSASFTPRWRPPFVTALEPTDRCHLNGLAMVDGRPKYVTALGEADAPAGWRANKARGGVVLDVDSGEVITRGLSMPHSPRWHGGRLWVCESGAGTLGFVDPNTGKYEPIAQIPGFTRGLEFAGNLAFVGLSQVRESAVFSGLPITERLAAEERTCGVCVIDVATGQAVALLRFDTGVHEVFAVAVLPGQRYPDLINDDPKLLENSFTVPDSALVDAPVSLRGAAVTTR
ncbi:TIGR03032 family protein [Paludisphaera mucosa]|uniref:TIGR03032 family protein n=1 Tax=Paludisphaera mucosa TaxID=3030827 RepID=A0ABT6FLP3_9BACT|nr:TIGR03032 family protein [Paludisphaera mucosa]MDG3008411.1 TIGR03032 family protein [Paludisphaera mucosa]